MYYHPEPISMLKRSCDALPPRKAWKCSKRRVSLVDARPSSKKRTKTLNCSERKLIMNSITWTYQYFHMIHMAFLLLEHLDHLRRDILVIDFGETIGLLKITRCQNGGWRISDKTTQGLVGNRVTMTAPTELSSYLASNIGSTPEIHVVAFHAFGSPHATNYWVSPSRIVT